MDRTDKLNIQQNKEIGFFEKIRFLAFIILLIVFTASSCFAEKIKFQRGDFKILPELDYSVSYNTNIYSDEKNKQSDLIHTLTPGIRVEKKFASHNLLSAGYSIPLVAYVDFQENNSQDHQAFLSADMEFPALNLSLTIDENYSRTSNLLGTEDNEYGKGEKTQRWNNTAGFTLSYDFGDKYTAELMYQNLIQRFDDDEDKWQNRFEHQYGLYLFYKLTGKTSFFVRFQQTLVEYDKQNDGISGWSSATSQDRTLNDFSIGVRFNPIGRLDGTASFGYGTMEYDNDVDKAGNPYDDDSSWTAETTLNYRLVSKTSFSYKLQRSYKGSADSDTSSYMDTLTGISVTQDIGNRLSAGFGLDWGYMDYSNDKSFNIYAVRTNFDWKIIEKLTLGVTYEYKKKNADDARYEDEEYETNNLSFSVNFSIGL